MKPRVWRDAIRDAELDRTAKLVAFVLSTYMNGSGETFVGKETVQRKCGFASIRTVDEAINRLEQPGFIEIVRSKGGQRPNHYLATTPQAPAGLTPHGDAGFNSKNPAISDQQPRSQSATTPHGAAPEVVFESEQQGERPPREVEEEKRRQLTAEIRRTHPGLFKGGNAEEVDRDIG
jgi:hypothetical protein